MRPPEVKPKSDWESFELPFRIGSGRGFRPDSKGNQILRMAFFKRKKDSALVGKVWFGDGIEGPPGFVHGGVSAYILDEAMGSAGWLARYPTVAKSIQVDFAEMTPIGQDLNIEAKVIEVKAKVITIEAKIFGEDDTLYSQSTGTFARLGRERVEKFLKTNPVPIDSKQFIFPESTK